jgi:MFS family permease
VKRTIGRAARSLREFPPQFWLLTAGILVYVIGVDMSYPFETLFLRNGLHISMTVVGLVLGLTSLAGLPFQILGGAFADHFGRRAVLVLAVCGSAVLYVGLALSHSLLQVVLVVAIEAAFGWSMFLTASNAMIADLTSRRRRAEAFGIVRTAINVSMIVGPLIALAFLGAPPEYRLLFAMGGAVCLVFLLIIVGAPHKKPPPRAGGPPAGGGYAHILRDRRFLAFCAVTFLPLYGYGQILSTFPVAMQEAHGISAGQWARLVLAYAVGLSVLQFPVVRLTRAWNPLLLLSGASALIGLGLGLAPWLPWGWLSVALVLLVSLGVVILIPVAATVVAAFAPVELRGRYMGAWTTAYLGGYALGPLCGGYAVDAMGSRGAYLVVAAAGLAGAVCFPLLRLGGRFGEPPGARTPRGGPPETSLETTLKPPVVGS